MVSPSRLEATSATKKTALSPSVGSSSKQPATSDLRALGYKLGTPALVAPNLHAPVRLSGDEASPLTPPARVLPEDVSSSIDDNNAEPTSSSNKVTDSNGAPPCPKAKAPKKTRAKRPRADANATSAGLNNAADEPAKKKRVRSSALMREAPRATSTTTPGGLAGNSEFMNFTATIFIIQLGPDGPQFHAHESVLKRSPKLAEEIDRAKANKRATKQNILPLMPHDVVAFEQMLQFLYKDKFLLSKNKTTAIARLDEFKELMSLAKHYDLPNLQKQIVKLFSSSKILARIPPGTFFDWAEDMYYEELDHEKGPFKIYLSKVAPMLMKAADEATRKDLVKMIKNGGGFAEQLFIAATTALDMQKDLMAVKKEEEKQESFPGLPRALKGKGKEPVRQTNREDVLNALADQIMEDEPVEGNESLFVQN